MRTGPVEDRLTADRWAGWATGAGIGLLALWPAWIVESSLAGLAWDPPAGPAVAFLGSLASSVAAGVVAGRHLARAGSTARTDQPGSSSSDPTSTPAARSAAAVTPSPGTRRRENVPSKTCAEPHDGLRAFSTARGAPVARASSTAARAPRT